MALSWNEIKARAIAFSKEWEQAANERAEAQSFWNDFFEVFGIGRKRVATFEESVKKLEGGQGFIDLFWPGVLLAESKSRGESLEKAKDQAIGYTFGLSEKAMPQYILLSDFENFILTDLESRKDYKFLLKDLYKKVQLFGFIAGYKKQEIVEENPANQDAAEYMASIYDALVESGYSGHNLKVLLVRLLFLLFADDTGVFGLPHIFQNYVKNRTSEDGSDLGYHLGMISQVLDTPREKRQKNTDELLEVFEYANGGLFKDRIDLPAFNSKIRNALVKAMGFDWAEISPAIFGSLFQGVMEKKERRALGAHYTSEANILKLIKPLFLDELYLQLEACGKNITKLDNMHEELGKLKFLDPACGCGNFLVIAYRELRKLESELLKRRYGTNLMLGINIEGLIKVKPSQFYGIEIEEFPARIAETAMWLVDHQMNIECAKIFGRTRATLPLPDGAHIKIGNALRLDWKEIIVPEQLRYILGNPPFIGKKEQTKEQKADLESVFWDVKSANVLDYVACWYRKALDFMKVNPEIKTAFVSTNSITQGEQVGILWNYMLKNDAIIHFAHRTFAWGNEARGKAAVHCVIIGFGLQDVQKKYIFEYENIKAEPHASLVAVINPYLVAAANVLLNKKSKSISLDAPEITYGSMPIDEGNLILTKQRKQELLAVEPEAANYIRRYMGGDEFLNSIERYCIWLVGCQPQILRRLPKVLEMIEANRMYRLSSGRAATKKLAQKPGLFGEIRQPLTNYLLIPKVSSENRNYIPIGFCSPDVIASGTALVVPNASLYDFGILQSLMHFAWVNSVCGRLESRFVYSAGIVYNNFPWPEDISEEKKQTIEHAAEKVLDVRAAHKGASLADLYDPNTMPPDLVKAHQDLDRVVDLAYTRKIFKSDAERLEFLFELYKKYIKQQ
jgi:type I restriction-modification system DNA methylase subunit